jgi:uncharacterized membrane protein
MSIQTAELVLLPNEVNRIFAAVAAAEQRTTVEFHVVVETTSPSPSARAHELLRSSTARGGRRQRMLLLLLAHDRRCCVVTDSALRPLESTRVWRDVEHRLTLDVLHGKLAEGLADAINRFSHIVGGHFPAASAAPSFVHSYGKG